ncbi:MAG: hypothetical protein ACYS8W_09600 [Planctomycetota bacterium]|jgi:hypothetical protein
MRRSFISALLVTAAAVSVTFCFAGCSDKDDDFFFPPKGPGAGGGPINGTFTFTAVEEDTLAPIEGVSVHVDGSNVSETKTTDSAGVAAFTDVYGPLDITLWRVPAAKTTLFQFDYAELMLPFAAPPAGGNGGDISVDLVINGVSGVDMTGTGDALGYAMVMSGESALQNEAFTVAPMGTTTVPDPIPITVSTEEPVFIAVIVGGIISLIPFEMGLTKYGTTSFPTGVPTGTTEIVFQVNPGFGIDIFDFAGTIDQSGLSFSPAAGLASVVADFGVDGILPVGLGIVDTSLDLYNGTGIILPDRNRYGFFLGVGSFDTGISTRMQWGSAATIQTIASSNVVLYDTPAITTPADNAIAISTTPQVAWTAVPAGANVNFYFVMLEQVSGPYRWVGCVDSSLPPDVTVPAVAALSAGTVTTLNVAAVAMENFDYSSLDPDAMRFEATYVGTSGIMPLVTAP